MILLILLFTGARQHPRHRLRPPKSKPAPAPAVTATPAAPATPAPQPAPSAERTLKRSCGRAFHLAENPVTRRYCPVYERVFPHLPELDQERASHLESLRNFDFTNLVFTVDKVESIDPATPSPGHLVRGHHDRRTQELASSSQIFQVRFAEEQEKWRIRSLEEVEP